MACSRLVSSPGCFGRETARHYSRASWTFTRPWARQDPLLLVVVVVVVPSGPTFARGIACAASSELADRHGTFGTFSAAACQMSHGQ